MPLPKAKTSLLREQIDALGEWFHNLDRAGIPTAPNHFLGNYPRCKWEVFADSLPKDLSGRTVLDLGCNAGFYAFEMKRRGADRVVAVDSDPRYLAQARLASKVLDMDIELRHLSIYEIQRLKEKFDLVYSWECSITSAIRCWLLTSFTNMLRVISLFFKSMQRGSEEVSPVGADYPFGETGIFAQSDFPAMYFIEKSYSGDPTNWWIPNRACAEAMLRSAGFEIVAHPEIEVYVCRRRDGPSHEFPKVNLL
jgi:tRNA (mo5U34)-methyltransferase